MNVDKSAKVGRKRWWQHGVGFEVDRRLRHGARAMKRTGARAWRDDICRVRGWRLLAGPAPNPNAVTRWVKARTDAELNVAAQLPDHSPVGREIAAQALLARGGKVNPMHSAAPSFLRPRDLGRGLALFFGWTRSVRRGFGLILFVGLFGALACAAVTMLAQDRALREGVAAGQISPAEYQSRGLQLEFARRLSDQLLARVGETPAGQLAQITRQGAIGFGALAGFGLLGWASAVYLRLRPARVVLLRRRDGRAGARDIEAIIANELRPFGHVVAMSDQVLRRRRFAWTGDALKAEGNPFLALLTILLAPVRMVLRVFDKSRYGAALVSSARDFRALGRRLTDRVGLNFEVSLTAHEAFLVRATEGWWQETAGLLMRSGDVVVMDMSAEREGDVWEATQLAALGLMGRAVFICRDQRLQEAQQALASAGLGLSHPIVTYGAGGRFDDRGAFRETMLAAIAHRVRTA